MKVMLLSGSCKLCWWYCSYCSDFSCQTGQHGTR